jgi:hypothetical protein
MNPLWDAAEAALALAQECLGDQCREYPRVLIETSTPVADCATLAVIIGNPKAYSGSCLGRTQMNANLDIHLIRCCDPVGDLTAAGGYTAPTAEAIQAAAACIVRDAWALYECIVCTGCDVIGSIPNVTACCDKQTGPPEIIWGAPSGGCRSAIVRVPLVFSTCCEAPA